MCQPIKNIFYSSFVDEGQNWIYFAHAQADLSHPVSDFAHAQADLSHPVSDFAHTQADLTQFRYNEGRLYIVLKSNTQTTTIFYAFI